jgi:sarcosine oxidase subunit beta
VKGLFFANGFSGHGVMHAPATGKLTSDLILRGTSELIDDPRAFALERFAEGRAIHETAIL